MPEEEMSPKWDATLSSSQNVEFNLSVIERWINSITLDHLAFEWGYEAPLGVERRLDWFRNIADEEWDFRRGKERNQILQVSFTDSQKSAIYNAALTLGLVAPMQPARQEYTSILVLGGLLRGCLTRMRTAKEFLDSGITANSIVGLGGTRQLTAEEKEQGSLLGIFSESEYEAMAESLEQVFQPTGTACVEKHEDSVPNASWKITEYSSNPRLAVVAAPSLEPTKRRSNTADTLLWWSSRNSASKTGSYLLITHQIYVPYQAATAVRTFGLPNNATVEVVGVTNNASDLGGLTQLFSHQNYLQEIGSAIRGFLDLWVCLKEEKKSESEK